MGPPGLEFYPCRGCPGTAFPSKTDIVIGYQRGGSGTRKTETKAQREGQRQIRGGKPEKERTVWECGENLRDPDVSRLLPVFLETNSDRSLTCYSENYQHDETFAP